MLIFLCFKIHVVSVYHFSTSLLCWQVEAWQQTLCGRGLQTPPALAVPLLQGDVQPGRGEGVAALLRLDQVPEPQEVEM